MKIFKRLGLCGLGLLAFGLALDMAERAGIPHVPSVVPRPRPWSDAR